jgi:uncharacterized protein YyaL (SSP411 family)
VPHPTPSRCLAVLALLLIGSGGRAEPPKTAHTNHLIHESSPYLLQHAHNPVDWYPWGEEAFDKAKKEGKLVFLSIGYSACHWCHVMERESFANDDVAKLMNDWFVCIKVDREERPDIDNIYMTALNVFFRQRGGWPLSMFLTAEGKPIVGGTYWPPEDKVVEGEKVPGFKTILARIHKLHTEKGKELAEQADQVARRTAEALERAGRGFALVELNHDLVNEAVDGIKEEFDRVHGGFGSAERKFEGMKFPVAPYLRLLQTEAARAKTADLDEILTVTLDHMAMGGIYDQLGGGFHRYSTERTWTVPHFEKMLYDNAQLTEVYAQAYRVTKKPLYRRVLAETLAFVSRELTTPEGGFYSALDADSVGEEGAFYVWTDKEIDAVLPDKADADLVRKVYGADGSFNFEGKAHILVLPKPLTEEVEAQVAPLRQKLFESRSKRPRPSLDTKVLTAWNGEMIAGYAAAGQVLQEPKNVVSAARAADFVLEKLRTKDGRLLRTYGAAPGDKPVARLNGFLDDYAFLVHGLLNLHDATNDKKWLDAARQLTDTMIQFHGDKEHGGFFYTSSDHEKLFARAKDQYDGAQPSGNSMAARNLVRLGVKTGEERYRALAEQTLKAFATPLKNNPTSLTTMAEALSLYLDAKK